MHEFMKDSINHYALPQSNSAICWWKLEYFVESAPSVFINFLGNNMLKLPLDNWSIHLLVFWDFIILFHPHCRSARGPCFVAQHQHCWGPALRFALFARCRGSAGFYSRCCAVRHKTGRFLFRFACVRKIKVFGWSFPKDTKWVAILKKSSPHWGWQWKNR